MATAWIDERVPDRVHLARGVARPLWIGRARRELFFASTKSALEVVEGALRLTLRKHEVAEGRLLHVERGRIVTETRFRADRSYRDDKVLPAGAGAARGRLLPREARDCSQRESERARPLYSEPSAADGDAFLAQALAHEELERGPRTGLDVDEPVDLPLRHQRRIAPPRLLPVGHLRQPPELPRERGPLVDRALELLVTDRHVEARPPAARR